MPHYDAMVIGTGGVGSAALEVLARRGQRVLGIDRFAPPHCRGSSHGQTRVIRQAYFEHPDYVPLLREAYRWWYQLEHRTGTRLLVPCGLLEIGPAAGEVVAGVRRAAAEHGVPVEELTAAEVNARWPALRIPPGLDVVYEPTAGYLLVEQCVATLLQEAQRRGATLCLDCELHRWQARSDCFAVETTKGEFTADSLVITAGAWATQVLSELRLPLTVLRKSLFWYGATSVPQAEDLPVYLYELPGGVYYGFPTLDGQTIKAAEHSGGRPVDDPFELERDVLAEEQQGVERFLAECVRGPAGPLRHHTNCLYTMTPDQHFVVDRHPHHRRLVYAAGLSGHGFKFAGVLGEALADLVIDGTTSLPIGFLSAGRLARFQRPGGG